MTSPHDIIEYPAQPGEYGRRALIEPLIAAGSPRTNSLTRLYGPQKEAYEKAQRNEGAPADNPDDETQQLGHLRGVAADIDASPENIRRLTAAGLVRPFPHEPWHWTPVHDVRGFAIIRSAPNLNPTQEEDMGTYVSADGGKTIYWYSATKTRARKLTKAEADIVRGGRSIGVNAVKTVGSGWLAQVIALGA